jgi:hypothetical protein
MFDKSDFLCKTKPKINEIGKMGKIKSNIKMVNRIYCILDSLGKMLIIGEKQELSILRGQNYGIHNRLGFRD